MPTELKRTAYYRHAVFVPPIAGLTLQTALTSAVSQQNLAENRQRPLGDKVFQVLNSSHVHSPCFCVDVHKWVEDQNHLTVERQPGASVWVIKEVPPPPSANPQAKRDFLPDSASLSVYQNHITFIQSKGLSIENVAEYFTWLIRDKCGLVPAGTQVQFELASATSLRARGLDGAKAIRIRKPLADPRRVLPTPGSGRRKPFTEKVVNVERTEAVKGVLDAVGLNVPSAILSEPETKDLELYFEIRRPHGREEFGNAAMNALGSFIAQHASPEFVVELLGGGELKGGELKLSKDLPFTVPTHANHPPPLEVFKALSLYMRDLIASKKV